MFQIYNNYNYIKLKQLILFNVSIVFIVLYCNLYVLFYFNVNRIRKMIFRNKLEVFGNI